MKDSSAQTTQEDQQNNKNQLILIALTILAAILRIKDIDTFWLSGDEATYIQIAHDSINDITNKAPYYAHPPFFFVLLKLAALFSEHIVSYRCIALVAGISCVPAIYHLGNKLFDSKIGLISAFLLAVSPACIMHSQIIRPYSVILLLSILSIYGLISLIKNQTHGLVIHLVCSFLGILTHYGFEFLNGALLLTALIFIYRNPQNKFKIKTLIFFHLLFLVIAAGMVFLIKGTEGANYLMGLAQKDYLRTYFAKGPVHITLSFFALISYFFGVSIAPIFIILFAYGIFSLTQKKDTQNLILIILPILVYELSSFLNIYPFGGSRHSTFAYPFLLLTCAIGINSINFKKAIIPLATLLILYAAFNFSEKHTDSVNFFSRKNNLLVEIEKDRNTHWDAIEAITEKALEQSKNSKSIIFANSAWLLLSPMIKLEVNKEYKNDKSVIISGKWKDRNVIAFKNPEFTTLICNVLHDLDGAKNNDTLSFVFGDWYASESSNFKLKVDHDNKEIITGEPGFYYDSITFGEVINNLDCNKSNNSAQRAM